MHHVNHACPGHWHAQEDLDINGDADACDSQFMAARAAFSSMVEGVTDIETSRAMAISNAEPDAETVSESGGTPTCAAADEAGDKLQAKMSFDVFDAQPSAPTNLIPEPKPKRQKANPKRTPQMRAAPASPSSVASNAQGLLGDAMASPHTKPQDEMRSVNPAKEMQMIPHDGANKKTNELMKRAREAFEKHQDAFADAKIWGNKMKRRPLESAIKSLNGMASSLLACNHPPADDLSVAITSWCDNAEVRFDALAKVRSSPLEFLDACETALEPLKALDPPMISNVILFVAGECLKGLDKAHLSQSSVVRVRVILSYHSLCYVMEASARATTENAITLASRDCTLRGCTSGRILVCLTSCIPFSNHRAKDVTLC